MKLASVAKTEGSKRIAVKIDERFESAKQALATALWLRRVDHAVREKALVMPDRVDSARISDESAARVLMSAGAMGALLKEMQDLQHKHAWQMEPEDCLRAQGVIVRFKAVADQSSEPILA